MKEMELMIHIPKSVGDCSHEMVEQLRRICDVCGKSLKLRKEWFYICLDDEENTVAVYVHDLEKSLTLQENWEKIDQEKWLHVSGGAYYAEEGSSKLVAISFAGVLSAHAQASPLFDIQNNERWITICIDAQLWKDINQDTFLQTVKEICIALGATYACIDESIPQNGMHGSWFRLFAQDCDDVDIEERLPGIYWTQMVSQTMVAKTGHIQNIIENIPCEYVERINNNGNDMLWMQITEDFGKASQKKRLSLREFFKDAIYQPSIEKARNTPGWEWENWKNMGNSQKKAVLRHLKNLPLTNDEIAKLLDME